MKITNEPDTQKQTEKNYPFLLKAHISTYIQLLRQ